MARLADTMRRIAQRADNSLALRLDIEQHRRYAGWSLIRLIGGGGGKPPVGGWLLALIHISDVPGWKSPTPGFGYPPSTRYTFRFHFGTPGFARRRRLRIEFEYEFSRNARK